MKISILIPAYKPNHKLLSELLESIVRTNKNRPEIIIGLQSGEDLSDEISKYNIRVVDFEKPSLLQTKKSLLSYATGDYIIYSDCDDLFVPGAIDFLISIISKTNSDLYVFKIYDFLENPISYSINKKKLKYEKITKENAYKSFCIGDLIRFETPSKCFKKGTIESSDFPKSDIFQGEDVIITSILLKKSENIIYIDEFLYQYRRYSTRGSALVKTSHLYDNLAVIEAVYSKQNIYTEYLVGRIFTQFCNTLYACPATPNFSFTSILNLYEKPGFSILLNYIRQSYKLKNNGFRTKRDKFLRFYFMMFAKKKLIFCRLMSKAGHFYRKFKHQ